MKPNEVVIIAENENDGSYVQGHADDTGEKFEFFDIFFMYNRTMLSFSIENFSEIVDLFRKIIGNEESEKRKLN